MFRKIAEWFRNQKRIAEAQAINDALSATADEIITIHRDGRVTKKPGPMANHP